MRRGVAAAAPLQRPFAESDAAPSSMVVQGKKPLVPERQLLLDVWQDRCCRQLLPNNKSPPAVLSQALTAFLRNRHCILLLLGLLRKMPCGSQEC